jgi:hypothetical protein
VAKEEAAGMEAAGWEAAAAAAWAAAGSEAAAAAAWAAAGSAAAAAAAWAAAGSAAAAAEGLVAVGSEATGAAAAWAETVGRRSWSLAPVQQARTAAAHAYRSENLRFRPAYYPKLCIRTRPVARLRSDNLPV